MKQISNGIAVDADGLHQEIKESMGRIPDALFERAGLFAHFNPQGEKTPLFWCFNNWAEAIFLAHRLGPEQPLYAMRSFYGFIYGKHAKRANTVGFAESYAGQALDFVDEGPILIGGNCQAAPIAEGMAHILFGKTGCRPLLITLEHMPTYSFPGDIMMLFGRVSEKFNPFLQGIDPVPEWRVLHKQPAWGIVDGGHGRFFMEPAVLDLASLITQACDEHCSGGLVGGEMFPQVMCQTS